MKRRSFCQAAGMTAGALFVPSTLVRAAGLLGGAGNGITYGLQVATTPDFTPGSLLVDSRALAEPAFSLDGLRSDTVYFWRTNASKGGRTTAWSETARFRTATTVAVESPAETPVAFELGVNYPNPFNPSTTIPFTLPEAGPVTLRVYNELGQEVSALLDGYRETGAHQVVWDAGSFASGRYFVVLQSGDSRQARTVVLSK